MRNVAAPFVVLLALAGPTGAGAQQMRVHENVDVTRRALDVHVCDREGNAIPGLTIDDFRLFVDGLEVRLESVEWVGGTARYPEGLAPDQAAEKGLPPTLPGRLIVFLFQIDFGLQRARTSGLMSMTPKARALLDTFTDDDRVAVATYDSHLKLQHDFTADRAVLKELLKPTVLTHAPARIPPGPFPSLAASFDYAAARDAATPERGLLVLADSLRALPGPKSLVFFGWGLGHFRVTHVAMDRDYPAARRALAQSRTTVYALDITDADYHTLEVGLEQVATDTGGFYVKTHLFPDLAMHALRERLAGHYTLVFARPRGPHGLHGIQVELARRAGTVEVQRTYED